MATFIEVDSTFRNRNVHANASNFVISTNSIIDTTAENASDPIANSMPITSWYSNMFIRDTLSSPTINGTTLSTGVGASMTSTRLFFTSAANQLRTEDDFYVGSVVRTPANGWGRITSYKYLGNDTAEITVDPPVDVAGGVAITLTDASDVTRNVLFVPEGEDIENYYVNYIIHNETRNEYRTITAYDATTHLITIDGDISTWQNDDAYNIRKDPPAIVSSLGASNASSLTLETGLTNVVGSFVRIQLTTADTSSNSVRRITSYNSVTGAATVTPALPSNPTGLDYEFLPFSRDNLRSLTYPGGKTGEDSYYSVTLLKIIIPNYILNNTGGGRVSDLPFVYVNFSPLNRPYSNVITTNNFNGLTATFIASYENYDNTNDKAYVHFVGSNMTQRLKMRLHNDYIFRIFTSDNEVLSFANINERFSPNAPNSRLQIKALFRFIRT